MDSVDTAARDDVTRRLARLAGHAASLKRLWEQDTACEDMLTQISAVRSALDQVGKVILQHHIDHCVTDAVENGRGSEAIRALKKALDRFV